MPFLLAAFFAAILASSLVLAGCSSEESPSSSSDMVGELVEETEPEPEPEPEPEIDPSVLKTKTTYLEYALDKTADPLSLVSCNDSSIEVSCRSSEVSLSDVGALDVVYILSRGAKSKDVTCSFIVRDTKAPSIEFSTDEITIDEGDSINILENVKSVTDPIDGDLKYVESEPDKIAQSGRQYEEGWYTISSNLDASTPGTYYIKVIACDIHGNRTEKEYRVVVNEVVVATPEPEPEPSPEPARNTRRYILNTNTHKFHVPSCGDVSRMKDKNKWDTDEFTRDEIIEMGYSPCGHCHP